MKNRDLYQRNPDTAALLNNGVAAMTDARTDDERQTLRFELEHFVCEGEYQRGMVRILESYVNNQGQPEQPAAWISGFFGSGKSHLAKMLRFLWVDQEFPEDGARARGLARLPTEVNDLLREITTLGRRSGGLHAAAGTLGSAAGDSVRLALLGVVLRSAGLPDSYAQARFALWLKRNGIYERVSAGVESEGRKFRRELNDMYVSPLIAKELLRADPDFAANERDARTAIRNQFPNEKDISNDALVSMLRDVLAPEGEMPCTVVVLDEVQQYIGEDANRSYVVQEVVEACSKQFQGRLLFVGTGQTALSGTHALQRLQGRFTVNVELSDTDVETVTRRVVLAKRADRVNDVRDTLDANAGEIDRHLVGTAIGPRAEDSAVLVDDYPLLPVRRRFWEQALRAVDRAGTAGQLRTQLRIVYDAIRHTADSPLGTAVPADFLFEEISASLLQSGVLLREINETITKLEDGTPDGTLKSRACALIFLIRKLPVDASADIGVRATASTLADLLVSDLARDGAALRGRIPHLLDELVEAGTLIKLDEEYSLQTRESSEWEAEFRARQNRLMNNPMRIGPIRAQVLNDAVQRAIGPPRLTQGASREPRKLSLNFGSEPPTSGSGEVAIWVRDGWGASAKNVVDDARAAGADDATIHVFVPRARADALQRAIAMRDGAKGTLDYKGVPSLAEGIEARQGMETRLAEAENSLRALVGEVVAGARAYQGGGTELPQASLADKIEAGANASLDRLFHEFRQADDTRWRTVIERARRGAANPLEAVDHQGKTEDHAVCAAVLLFVGSGRRGRDVRTHFASPPYGWPRDAVDAALVSLFASGHLRATLNGTPLAPGQLDQGKVSTTDFRVESATIETHERLKLRQLLSKAGVPVQPNEEAAAAKLFLGQLAELAARAGGAPPLPSKPDTSGVEDIQSLVGNEQLRGILDRHDELLAKLNDWTAASEIATARLPSYERVLLLAEHADGVAGTEDLRLQLDAIAQNRSLLDATDPLPDLARGLVDVLRGALVAAERRHLEVFKAQSEAIEEVASWQTIEPSERAGILRERGAVASTKGPTGTEQEVIESLSRTSLKTWRTRTAALPQLFAEARMEADRLVEPKVRHIKLDSGPLRSPEEAKEWLAETERRLLEELEKGPIAVS
ncbi:MAG: BREX system P-loop protein BrxC [Gammaproteobacteria bacterium]|nr:BREX system P-loop protein BrxC [Gammaproteobacteria bacterium]